MHLRRISPLQSVCGGGNSPASAALAQLVRALDCGSRGPLFKPGRRYHSPKIEHTIKPHRCMVFDLSQRRRHPDVTYPCQTARCLMLQMAAIFHIFIGSTLAGVAIIFALVMGVTTMSSILIAAAIGFVVSFPVTWMIAKMVYRNE